MSHAYQKHFSICDSACHVYLFFCGKACRVYLLDACRISIECICIPSVISKSDEDTFVGYLYNFDTCRILLAKLYVLLIKRKCLCCVGFLWAQITSLNSGPDGHTHPPPSSPRKRIIPTLRRRRRRRRRLLSSAPCRLKNFRSSAVLFQGNLATLLFTRSDHHEAQ
jgi:hypothetical protein